MYGNRLNADYVSEFSIAPRNGDARICFVGDMMLGRKVSAAMSYRHPTDFFGDTLDLLNAADAVVTNLESPITDCKARWSEGWKAFRFAASPQTMDLLTAANVRAANLANNHILDCTERGLADTLMYLDRANIAHAGGGMDLRQAWRPALFRAGPLSVGLIGITDNMKEFAAGPRKAGSSYLDINTRPATLAAINGMIGELIRAGADSIVLSVHWGPNLRPSPPESFRLFARAVIDLGVDVVHGHSAHLFQGVETYGGGFILYDTGDFLDDYWILPGIRTDHSFAFVVDYDHGRPNRLTLVPVKLDHGQVALAKGEDFTRITATMTGKSARLGTALRPTKAGLLLSMPAADGISSPSDHSMEVITGITLPFGLPSN